MPWGLRVVIVLVAAFSLLVALLWIFQRRLIYQPDNSPVPSAATVLPGGRDVTLHTDDDPPPPGSAHVYRVTASQEGMAFGGYTVVVMG